jgi:predicted nucleotidyltransferase
VAGAYASVVTMNELRVDVDRVAEICQRFGIQRLEVFGSFARDDAGQDSDVDLLYELAPGARLGWEIEDLAEELAAVLGRRVDLVAKVAVHPALYSTVLSQARTLYAA